MHRTAPRPLPRVRCSIAISPRSGPRCDDPYATRNAARAAARGSPACRGRPRRPRPRARARRRHAPDTTSSTSRTSPPSATTETRSEAVVQRRAVDTRRGAGCRARERCRPLAARVSTDVAWPSSPSSRRRVHLGDEVGVADSARGDSVSAIPVRLGEEPAAACPSTRHAGNSSRRSPCRAAEPGPTATSAIARRERELDDAATRARGAIAHHDHRPPHRRRATRARRASWPMRASSASLAQPARLRARADAQPSSIAAATSSIEEPHSVSCGWRLEQRPPGGAQERARRGVAAAVRERDPRLDVAHEQRARHRVPALLCARAPSVPWSVHV